MTTRAVSAATHVELVARDNELAQLEELYSRSSAGRLCCALIVGEPGSGKTRLAMELLERHTSGCVRLTARGYPFGASTTFGLWIEALDRYMERLKTDQVVAPPQLTPHQRLLIGIAQVLRELAEQSPLIILLDDIHHADGSSWEALAYLARNLADSRILLVACGRTADLSLTARANQVLLGLEQEGILTRTKLDPLPRTATEALIASRLGRRPPATLVDWLYEKARGNPFFTIELLRALVERDVNLAAPALSRLPKTIVEHVQSRVDQVPAGARRTLEILVVAGRPLPLRWLAILSLRTSDALAADVAELLARDLIQERLENRVPSFEVIHPLVREAVDEGMSLARRQQIGRSLAHLLRVHRRLAEAAMHYSRSAEPGDSQAIETLIDALREAERRQSPLEATAVLEGLLALLPSGDPRWSQVLDAMVWDADWVLAYNAYVSVVTATRAMKEIESVLRERPDPLRQAVVNLRLAAFNVWDLSQREQTARMCRSALDIFERAEQRRLALMARHWLAWLAGVSNDLREMEREARQVVEEAEAQQDRGVLEHAHGALAWSLLRQGRFGDADRSVERVVELAEQSGNVSLLAYGLSARAFVCALDGRLIEAQALRKQAGTLSPAAVDPRLLGSTDLLAGDATSAFTALRHELTGATPRPNALHAWSLAYGSIAAARLGHFDEAQTWLDAAQPYRGRIGFGWDAFLLWAQGTLALESADETYGLPELQEAATAMLETGYVPSAAIVLADTVESAWLAGDRQALSESVSRLGQIDGLLGNDLYSAISKLGTAYLQFHDRNPEASSSASQAATTLKRLGYRDWEARALQVEALALGRAHRRQAVDCLRQVIELASRGGTVRRYREALNRLEQLGRPGRRVALSTQGPDSLSRRERQVIRLAIRGLTSRNIGQDLHISPRTVETHLNNAYAKIGVKTRVDLIRHASELRLG